MSARKAPSTQPRPPPGAGANPARPAQPAPAEGPSRERGHRHARARRGAADRLPLRGRRDAPGRNPLPAGPPVGGPRGRRRDGGRGHGAFSRNPACGQSRIAAPGPAWKSRWFPARFPPIPDSRPSLMPHGLQTGVGKRQKAPPSTGPPTGTCTRPATASHPHARGRTAGPGHRARPRHCPAPATCSPPRARKPPSRPAAPGRRAPPWSDPAPAAGGREPGLGNTRRHRSHLPTADVNESRSAVRDRRDTRAPGGRSAAGARPRSFPGRGDLKASGKGRRGPGQSRPVERVRSFGHRI